jgi:hypothetical protein
VHLLYERHIVHDAVGTHAAALCWLHACRRRAWISGHPLGKAPMVDRTGPGMAWHGVVRPRPSLSKTGTVKEPSFQLTIASKTQGLGQLAGEESKITDLAHAAPGTAPTHHPSGVAWHAQGEASSSLTTPMPSHLACLAVPTWPAADADAAGRACFLVASSLSMGPSDVQHGLVYKSSLSHALY